VVHISPDAPAVNVLVNGNVVFEGLPYKGFTDYTPVPATTLNVAVQVASSGATVLTSSITLQPGAYYTFFAMGRVSGGDNPLQLRGVGDTLHTTAGSLTFRVVHGAPSAPAVDIYATAPYTSLAAATPILRNVPFGIGSDYFTVPGGLYQARVTVAGTRTVAISSGPLPLRTTAVRTIVALNPPAMGMPFELLILPDADAAEMR
jgi:hypothetical protein